MEVGKELKNKSNYEIKLKAESESGWRAGKKEIVKKKNSEK